MNTFEHAYVCVFTGIETPLIPHIQSLMYDEICSCKNVNITHLTVVVGPVMHDIITEVLFNLLKY